MHTKKTFINYSPLFVIPAFILFGLFFILPNVAGLFLGFTDWNSYFPLKPEFAGITNFKDMIDSSIFFISIKNTIYFTIVTTLIKISLGFLLALVLNDAIRFKNLYRTIVFSPIVINPMIIAMIFFSIYNPQNGILNVFLRSIGLGSMQKPWLIDVGTALNAICAMEVWMSIGVIVVIFLAGLQSVPKEYYEVSTIDGASKFRQIFHVTVPLVFQSITICTMLCLTRGMAVFAQVYGLTNGGPADKTQVYATFIFKQFSQGLFGYSAAAGLVFVVVMSLLSFTLLTVFRKMEVEY